MNQITLTVTVPEGTSPDQVADIAWLVADTAHKCTDWNDRAEWVITQTDGKTFSVSTPDPRTRHAGTSGGAAQ